MSSTGLPPLKIRYMMLSPNRPKLTTAMPMTEPLLKATRSPSLRLRAAAAAVRTLARTATYIPR